jgi:hypothetical protein
MNQDTSAPLERASDEHSCAQLSQQYLPDLVRHQSADAGECIPNACVARPEKRMRGHALEPSAVEVTKRDLLYEMAHSEMHLDDRTSSRQYRA